MKRKQPERDLHKAVADLLDLALTPASFWYPIPNGPKLNKITAAMLKRTKQIRAGMPDIGLVSDGRSFFIELKAPKGRATGNQWETAAALGHAGAQVAFCRSLDEVVNALKAWGIPVRARAA